MDSASGRPPGSPSLYDLSPCRADPLFHLLKERWRLSPVQCGLFFFTLWAVVALLALIDGNFFPRPGLWIAYAQGPAEMAGGLLFTPLLALLAMRFYLQVETTFERLFSEGVVQAGREEYNPFLERLHRRYNSRKVLLGVVLVTLLIWAPMLQMALMSPGPTFFRLPGTLTGWYLVPLVLVTEYFVCMLVVKAVITAQAMQSIFNWPVRVQPFHPDGCGGLRRLTEISVTLALFVALATTSVELTLPIERNPQMALFAAVFAILAPLLFFSLLARAHRVMREYKERVLTRLNEIVQEPYADLFEGLDRRELRPDASEAVLRIDALHNFAEKLPAWPVNTRILAQVGLSVLLPLLLVIFQLVAENVLR